MPRLISPSLLFLSPRRRRTTVSPRAPPCSLPLLEHAVPSFPHLPVAAAAAAATTTTTTEPSALPDLYSTGDRCSRSRSVVRKSGGPPHPNSNPSPHSSLSFLSLLTVAAATRVSPPSLLRRLQQCPLSGSGQLRPQWQRIGLCGSGSGWPTPAAPRRGLPRYARAAAEVVGPVTLVNVDWITDLASSGARRCERAQ